jgi:polysaccharide biosynthesis/export protein
MNHLETTSINRPHKEIRQDTCRRTPGICSTILGLLCLSWLGAGAEHKYLTPPPEFFQSHQNANASVIGAGDVLSVKFYYNPELNKTVKVREDGKISLALFQGIQAVGQTPEQLQKELVKLYSREFTNPDITIDVETTANSSVYVSGEVLLPGPKEIHGKVTVAMVLAMSQVSQKTGGTKSVFLIRGSKEGEYKVYKLDASLPGGSARDIEVAPGDVLFVPRKAIVKVDDFMEQYVRELLPATPSASTTVLFTPGNPNLVTGSTASH